MWRQDKKHSSIINLVLLLALSTISTAANILVSAPMLAESATDKPAFGLPQSVENGTTIRIDSSENLMAINQGLKQSFEKQFSGTKVEVAANGTEAALKGLLDGKVDLVILNRGLTPEEKAQGLEQVRLRREKIAIVVGAENPFSGNLTNKEFAKIFRGEITDWSQVGGTKGKIRVIDRPTTSDTRNTFRNYPAFKTSNFATGSNSIQLAEDNTAEIIKELGKDGISYGLVNEFSKLQDVRMLNIDKISPNSAKYPFSQPLVYVYKQNPTPGTAAFLGFTLAPPGQKAIDEARIAQGEAIARSRLQLLPVAATPSPTAEATDTATPSPTAEATDTATPSPTPEATQAATDTATVSPTEAAVPIAKENNSIMKNPTTLIWLVLALVGGLTAITGWWLLGRRSKVNKETENLPESTGKGELPQGFPDQDSHSEEGSTLTASNAAENINSPQNATLKEEVPVGGSLDNDTNKNRDYAGVSNPASAEAAWEIEGPANIVNTPYPPLPDVPIIVPSEGEQQTADTSASLQDLPIDTPGVIEDISNSNIEATQEPTQQQPQVESNSAENTSSIGDAALAGGAALATGAAIWSATSGTESDIPENNQTNEINNITERDSLPEITSDVAEQTQAAANTTEQLPEITPDVAEQTQAAATTTEQLPEITPDVAEQTQAAANTTEQLPEVALNAVADAAEPTADFIEEDAIEIVSNLPEETTPSTSNLSEALAGGAALAAGAGIYGMANASQSEEQNIPVVSQSPASTPEENIGATIVITPRSHQEADITWHIPEKQKQALANSGVSQLAIRLYDTTGVDLSYQNPQLVQQYECEPGTEQRLVAIPRSDRNYIAEIGYISDGEQWVKISRSPVVRIFSPPHVEETTASSPEETIGTTIVITPRSHQEADITWHIPETQKQALANSGVSQLAIRLYDTTGIDLSYQNPQLVQQYECEPGTEQRLVAIPRSDRNYIAEIGYIFDGEQWVKISRTPAVRIFSPPQVEETTASSPEETIGTTIVITPRSHQEADITWHIPETQKQALAKFGISQLAIRLYDTTGVDLSYQNPQLVQEYECEPGTEQRLVAIPRSDRNYIAEIGYIFDGEQWVKISRTPAVRIFSPPQVEETTASSPEENIGTTIVITPRSHQEADITWHMPEKQKQALAKFGISQFAIRLYDTTGIDLSYQNPQLVQQYECEPGIEERLVEIKRSDRNYIAEIGYISDGKEWVTISRTPVVRIFSPPHVEETIAQQENVGATIEITPRTPKWCYLAWHIPSHQKQTLENSGVSQLAIRLYDTTGIDLSYQSPQLVQQYECEPGTHDRFVAIPRSDRDYIAEIGYITVGEHWVAISRSPAVRIFNRPDTDFWFVADAELIIHGATEPNATVTIGGHTIKLKPDGTFHFRIPFTDSLIDYLLTANSADGEHTKTIHKKFSQETPEA